NKLRHDIVQVLCKFEMIFLPAFFTNVDTAFNRPQRNNDGGVRNAQLSVFCQSARPLGEPVRGEAFSKHDMEVAHWFVLNNCDEIILYLDEHEEMMKQEHPSQLYSKKHREMFPQWFLEYVNKLKSENSPIYSEELYNLAFGPISAELFSSGGESTDIDFYGKLTTVVQLLYKDRYQVIMFKCQWFDTNPNRQGSVKIDHGLLSVNINKTWYDDDPYILANMAKQIVYLDDPKAGHGWKVVQQMDQRNVYAIPELDPFDNDVDLVDQRFESSMENVAQTLMSDLIRSRKAVTTASSLPPPETTSAATAPAQVHAMAVSKKHTRGPCRQLKTAKVTRVTNSRINIGYDERHRAAPTADQLSSLAHDIGHVVRTYCPMKWKSWKAMPDEVRITTNYNLENLDDEMWAYINRLFAERHKQWKSDLHHHFQTYDDLQVALQEGCPKELEGRADSWEWLCGHFQEADFLKQAKANKGNRAKKTLLHHSGSRPFSYRMEERRRILTETLDQSLGRRPGTYCRGMGNARRLEPRPRSSTQVTTQATAALTAKVTMLETQMAQMTQFLQSLAQVGVPIPPFTPSSTSEPIQPEHGHHTSAPSDNAQPSVPHSPEDNVDFGNLFN
ncbi:unnamed protein product, partial [Prunus brigantina]